MSKKLMKYKSFSGSVEVSIEDSIIFGKIECINDLITYEAETIPALELAFQEAVDDYIETCELLGKAPEKPMSGSFNIRVGSELHKKAYLSAKDLDLTLNEFVKIAVTEKVERKQEVHMHIHMPKKESESKTYTSEFISKSKSDSNVFDLDQVRRAH